MCMGDGFWDIQAIVLGYTSDFDLWDYLSIVTVLL
jgi:hypothetical protein